MSRYILKKHVTNVMLQQQGFETGWFYLKSYHKYAYHCEKEIYIPLCKNNAELHELFLREISWNDGRKENIEPIIKDLINLGWVDILKEVKETKFLIFNQYSTDGKTDFVKIFNKSGEIMGFIYWQIGWRKYVYEPKGEIVLDTKCMLDIIGYIDNLMKERKTK